MNSTKLSNDNAYSALADDDDDVDISVPIRLDS